MSWHLNVSWKAWRCLVFVVLGYMAVQTSLFIAAFNLWSAPLRLAAVLAWLAYLGYAARRLWRAPWSAWLSQPLQIFWPAWLLAIFILCSVHLMGPLSGNQRLPNFDWYKYSVILYDVAQNPLQPQINFGSESVELAYYYAIYLPAGWIGWIGQHWLQPNSVVSLLNGVFEGWLLFGQLLALSLLPLILRSLFPQWAVRSFGISYLFFILFAQADGLEFWLRTGIGLYRSDLEWGPIPWYFVPLRLQSFLSSSFWVPGHLTASLLGLGLLLSLRSLPILKRTPWLLIYLYTVSSSLFAFISIQLLIPVLLLQETWSDLWLLLRYRWREVVATFVACTLVLLLFALDHLYDLVLVRSFEKLLLLLATITAIVSIRRVRQWLQKWWWHSLVIATGLWWGLNLLQQHKVFASLPAERYGLFMLKEFGPWLLVVLISSVAMKRWRLPRIVVVALCYLVILTVFGNPDFLFSGAIGGLLIVAAYLGQLAEELWHSRRWWVLGSVMVIYLALVGQSLASLSYETNWTLPRTSQSFDERVSNFKRDWRGLFDVYTSTHIREIKF